ncbi:hypothetical protein [Diadegma fenestrale ichnovirus]|nr:hypothetical protein [Diadegma fenestrale ichnovirus]
MEVVRITILCTFSLQTWILCSTKKFGVAIFSRKYILYLFSPQTVYQNIPGKMKVLLILMVAVASAQARPEGRVKQDLGVLDVSTSFVQLLPTNR